MGILPGGYNVGDAVQSCINHTFKNGSRLRRGDEGMVIAPGGDPSDSTNDMRLYVTFGTEKVIIPVISLRPRAGGLSPSEFQISIDRSSDSSPGLGLEIAEDSGTLVIKSISSGLIEDWNSKGTQDATLQVCPGDRIMEVNGIRGDPTQLVSECGKRSILTITIMRQAK